MKLTAQNKTMYGMLRLNTLASLALLTYDEYDLKASLILQSRFKNAMKIANEEVDRASKKIYSNADLTMLGQTDEMHNIFSMIINATMNAYGLEEEKAIEMIRRVKSVMTDYEVCEREPDYLALYTMKEAVEVMNRQKPVKGLL